MWGLEGMRGGSKGVNSIGTELREEELSFYTLFDKAQFCDGEMREWNCSTGLDNASQTTYKTKTLHIDDKILPVPAVRQGEMEGGMDQEGEKERFTVLQ